MQCGRLENSWSLAAALQLDGQTGSRTDPRVLRRADCSTASLRAGRTKKRAGCSSKSVRRQPRHNISGRANTSLASRSDSHPSAEGLPTKNPTAASDQIGPDSSEKLYPSTPRPLLTLCFVVLLYGQQNGQLSIAIKCISTVEVELHCKLCVYIMRILITA